MVVRQGDMPTQHGEVTEADEPEPGEHLELLVARCIERMQLGDTQAVETVCAEHPEHALRVRERILRLGESGLLESGAVLESGGDAKLVVGSHTLLRELGRGGMGVVYLARDERLGREVALKVLPVQVGLRERDVERFRREIRALSGLSHPGIVGIHEGDVANGMPYFTMDYVDGLPLSRSITTLRESSTSAACVSREQFAQAVFGGNAGMPSSWGRSVIEATCRILISVAQALHYAHQRGVLHRDVKPSNILVDRDGNVRLIDFGLAHVAGEPGLTRTGDLLGTPSYMAPELIEGRAAVDARADVYALGVVLYELLTLRKPFDGSTPHVVAQRIIHEEPALPRRFHARLPRDLEAICLKALEKAPERRYASTCELAEDLTYFLEYRPIRARPVRSLARVARFVRRSPALATSIGLAFVLLFGAPSLIVLRELRAAERIRDEAQHAEQLLDVLLQEIDAANPLSRQPDSTGIAAQRERLDRIAARFDGLPGINPSLRMKAQIRLACAYRGIGSNDRALDRILAELDSLIGKGHVDSVAGAALLHEIGITEREQGDYGEATVWLEAAGEARARLLGPADPALADTFYELGWARWLRDYGNSMHTRAPFEEALRIRRQALGGEHLLVAETRATLEALDRSTTGRFPGLESVLRLAGEQLGEHHPRTAYLRAVLGHSERLAGHLVCAESLLEHATEDLEGQLGAGHPHVRFAMHELHDVYFERGDYDLAEASLRSSMAITEPFPDELTPIDRFNLWELANVMAMRGSFDEAEALMWHLVERGLRAGATDVGDQIQTIGRIRWSRGRVEEAVDLLKAAFLYDLVHQGAGSRMVAADVVRLANALADLDGGVLAAERLLHRAIEICRRLEDRSGYGYASNAFPDALESLAALRMETGVLGEAELLLRESLAYRRAAGPDGHWKTARSRLLLADCLVRVGSCDEALALADEGLEGLSGELAPSHPEMSRARACVERVQRACQSRVRHPR